MLSHPAAILSYGVPCALMQRRHHAHAYQRTRHMHTADTLTTSKHAGAVDVRSLLPFIPC